MGNDVKKQFSWEKISNDFLEIIKRNTELIKQ